MVGAVSCDPYQPRWRPAVSATLTLVALFAAPPVPATKPALLGVQIARGKEAVLVLAVLQDSPAEKGGLQAGDFLLRINDVRSTDLQGTVEVIRSLTPGKKVKFLIRRDGKEKV